VRDHGITLLMATHSLEVAGHADRVLSMVSGRLEERPWP
jgi:predicted ABC-type transport system involved in lysophospholipase L1 biosynthesis ATPase subunit